MKKRKKQQKNSAAETKNLVAKHAHYFNKAVIFKDKSKYQRKAKHKQRPISYAMHALHKKWVKVFTESSLIFLNLPLRLATLGN